MHPRGWIILLRVTRMYGWVAGEATGDYIENFKTSLSAGFTAYKTCPVPAVRYLETPAVMARVVQNVAQLRALAGQDVDIGLDFHGRTTPALAKRLCKKLFVSAACTTIGEDEIRIKL